MKNNTLSLSLLVFGAFVLYGAVSCTKFEEDPPYTVEGETVPVQLTMRVAREILPEGNEIPITRVPDDTEIYEGIDNIWIFQFDGEGDNAILVGLPYYIDEEIIQAAKENGSPVIIPLIESGETLHRLVFIGNINNKSYSWNMFPGINTYADLKNKGATIRFEHEAYGSLKKNLIMSGSALSVIQAGLFLDGKDGDGTGTGIPLTRSLAKISFRLSVDAGEAAGYQVKSVQLRNISTKIDYTDALKEYAPIYPHVNDLVSIDYPKFSDDDALIRDGEYKEFTWYVPRNTRGTYPVSSSPKTKNIYAQPGSTFLEIIANDSDGAGVLFRIYPGADNTSDFNIIPNHHYRMNFNIVGNGGEVVADSRIEQFGNLKFNGNANSFILNPPMPGMSPRKFSIPVTRVNEYWYPDEDGFGGKLMNILDPPSTPPREWTADVLWQDRPDMIRPLGSSPEQYAILEKSEGEGGDDWFTVSVPPECPEGNIVVCLRIKGSPEILWSWHLWITPYNPNQQSLIAVNGNKWTYGVPGGQVERYGGKAWGHSGRDTDNWNNYDYNSEVSNETPYAKSVMMDRALGSGLMTAAEIAYQYGRKDPISFSNTLYDIHGDAISSGGTPGFSQQKWSDLANYTPAPQGENYQAGIENPMVLFGGQSDWSNVANNDIMWLDSRVSQKDFLNKSFFDPCPYGWKVPSHEVWADFRMNKPSGIYTVNSEGRGLKWNAGFYYWPYEEIDNTYPVLGTIFYPGSGYRNNSDGKIFGRGTQATYRSTTTYNVYGYSVSGTSSNMQNGHQPPKANAIPVRCISEPFHN